MYIAAGQGQGLTTHFDINKNILSLWSFVASLKSPIHFFNEFMHEGSPGAGADNPLGTTFWCQQEHLVTSVICCNFEKISLKTDFIHFFHDFIHVYSPQETRFWCQQKYRVTSSICCKFQKNVFEVWFYTLFFHDFIYVYRPRAGADSPKGTKFWCLQKGLITLPICCKFQRNLLEVWF